MLANVVATAGGVIFTGTMGGDFLALDASKGNVLYRHALGASVAGGVITYALSGTQYVAVESGYVSKFFGGSATTPEYALFSLASR
jgi:alcohol dehydrogenase (cytochrome c)